MAARSDPKDNATAGSILLVIHDFVARSGDELSLAKGDRIELIERDDEFGDGWYLGRHMTNGATGLFPEVYTTPAPKGTLTGAANPRRASDGPPKPTIATTGPATTTQQRHVSASVVQRPTTSDSAQQNNNRTSLPTATPAAARTPNLTPNLNGGDSQVMNETLSVINEHITDMNTPRTSYANGGNKRDTIGSVYSANHQPLQQQRISYIPGHETDEDENHLHTHDEVFAWSPERVAEYLEDHGVEKMHCDVFREQEITGEVVLAMDQSSLFIKEFELGPVGRRLKTWGKIKSLQEEVKQSQNREAARPTSPYIDQRDDATGGAMSRTRSSTVGSVLPRALEPSSRQSFVEGSPIYTNSTPPPQLPQQTPQQQNRLPTIVSPLQSMTSLSRPENTQRPSAQNIRVNQSRRHSSIDSTAERATRSHRKQPSMDQQWQPGQPVQTYPKSPGHSYTMSADSMASGYPQRNSRMFDDPDKAYHSSNDTIERRKPNVLQKRDSTSLTGSPGQSRTASFIGHSRATSGPNPSRDSQGPVSPPPTSAPSQGLFGSVTNKLGALNIRSATTPNLEPKAVNSMNDSSSPVVTKLDYSNSPSTMDASPTMQMKSETSSVSNNATPSPSSGTFGFFGQKLKSAGGLRTTSDAVTKEEKTMAGPTIPSALKEETPSTNRTGSTTPSTEAQSVDYQKSEDHSRASTGSGNKLMPPPASTRRPRVRNKKTTSAYTRGLEKKTPAESMATCDYSGWMKKKSGSLMSTWKPRLFILRGRRLSYYYKDDDSEEKGLIDISFHRVLPATHEMLTGFHATLTGAGTPTPIPTSPTNLTTPTSAETDLRLHPPLTADDDSGLFIFKLVPPKAGLSKAVNFTKPTVHYFAVNSRQEGRLWMAALMKATIDRDDDGVVTTTYNQKTISLAKARARKERPPALREEDMLAAGIVREDDDAEAAAEQEDDNNSRHSAVNNTHTNGEPNTNSNSSEGLGIGGLPRVNTNTGGTNNAIHPASAGMGAGADDANSIASSTGNFNTAAGAALASPNYSQHEAQTPIHNTMTTTNPGPTTNYDFEDNASSIKTGTGSFAPSSLHESASGVGVGGNGSATGGSVGGDELNAQEKAAVALNGS